MYHLPIKRSVLVFRRGDKFYHLDSTGGNSTFAKKIVRKLEPLFNGKSDPLYFFHSSCSLTQLVRELVHVRSPQQENSYDCGVYTLAFLKYLSDQFARAGTIDFSILNRITPRTITDLREEILLLISSLQKE